MSAMSLFQSHTAAARAVSIRRRILDEKEIRGPATTDAMALITQYRSMKASEGLPRRIRRGLRTRDRLAAMRFAVDEFDILAGRTLFSRDSLAVSKGGNVPDSAIKEAEAYWATLGFEGGQGGHCELDRSRAFDLGLDALRTSLADQADAAQGAKRETYQAFALSVEGLSTMIDHAAATVAAAIPAAAAARKSELELMAVSSRRVAHQPPKSFMDALHLLWFIDLGVQFANDAWLAGPGHLDRTLYPFYRRDIDSGALTTADALQLIEALYLHINHSIGNGGAVPVMVGGRDAKGGDVTNELSYLCLDALRRTNLVYPTVGVCWHEATPPELTALCVELISKGYATPALFGDETIQRGLRHYGVSPVESHNYINSCCVEITPAGGSNVWVASPYFSTCQILLEEIDAQAAAGDKAATTFDDFFSRYLARISCKIISEGVIPQNGLREMRRQNGGKPLQSVFTADCVARGLDIDEGGARYNWVECSFVGLANLADSLAVIRAEVFEGKTMDFKALKKTLDGDFKGEEPLRQHFLKGHPKYGNAAPEVDTLVAAVVERVKTECARHKMAPNEAHFIPGAFCWVMHERLGSACGATPDGRKAGFPFADGGGPAQGREAGYPLRCLWCHNPESQKWEEEISFARVRRVSGLAPVRRMSPTVASQTASSRTPIAASSSGSAMAIPIANIHFTNLTIRSRSVRGPRWWGNGEPCAVSSVPRTPDSPVGHIRNIRFRDIDAEGDNAVIIHGLPGHPVEDVELIDVCLRVHRRDNPWIPEPLVDLRPTSIDGGVHAHAGHALIFMHVRNVHTKRLTIHPCGWPQGQEPVAVLAEDATLIEPLNMICDHPKECEAYHDK